MYSKESISSMVIATISWISFNLACASVIRMVESSGWSRTSWRMNSRTDVASVMVIEKKRDGWSERKKAASWRKQLPWGNQLVCLEVLVFPVKQRTTSEYLVLSTAARYSLFIPQWRVAAGTLKGQLLGWLEESWFYYAGPVGSKLLYPFQPPLAFAWVGWQFQIPKIGAITKLRYTINYYGLEN